MSIDRPLRSGDPAAVPGQGHDELLAAQMLDVAGQVRSGHRLEEGSDLSVDGGGARSEGLERRVDGSAALETAPERLRDSRPVGCLHLGQTE